MSGFREDERLRLLRAETKTISVEEQRHYAEDAKKPTAEIEAITKPKEEIRFLASGIRVVK